MLDAVLFADPKQSKIDIVQAAGRALRRFDGKDFGYIIVPIVIEEGDDAQLSTVFGQNYDMFLFQRRRGIYVNCHF